MNKLTIQEYLFSIHKLISTKYKKTVKTLDDLLFYSQKYNIKLIAYNKDLEVICSNLNLLPKTRPKNMIFIYSENFIYPLKKEIKKKKVNKNTINKNTDTYFKSRINNFKIRDLEKNKKTILLDELFKDKDKFKDYQLWIDNYFCHYDFVKEIHKCVKNFTDNDYNNLKFLLANYGCYIKLEKPPIKITREMLNKDFISKYLKKDSGFWATGGFMDLEFISNNLREEYIITELCERLKKFNNVFISNYDTTSYYVKLSLIDTENTITINELRDLLKENKCNICKEEKNGITIDAINACLGHVKNNCQVLCRSCNSKKGVSNFYDDFNNYSGGDECLLSHTLKLSENCIEKFDENIKSLKHGLLSLNLL